MTFRSNDVLSAHRMFDVQALLQVARKYLGYYEVA